MNYLLLILVGLAGVALGMYLARRGQGAGTLIDKPLDYPRDKQTERKVENKEKILQFLREHGQIQNNDVEKLVGVSNASAERYLDELEKEGKLTQHGVIGQGVFYTLK